MKKLLWVVLGVSCGIGCRAQTFAEWFEQKKTQISYLEQQIAALEAYVKVTEEGYKIVRSGTQAIAAIKQGDFALHSGYFDGLLTVRQGIDQYPVVQTIVDMQNGIMIVSSNARQQAALLPEWSPVVNSFFDGLQTECVNDLDWLKTLTTDGQVQMTDEERVAAIDKVYDRMKSRYRLAVNAWNGIILLSNKAIS